MQGKVFQMVRQAYRRSSREDRAELFFLTHHCLEKQQAACIDIKPQFEIECVLISGVWAGKGYPKTEVREREGGTVLAALCSKGSVVSVLNLVHI